MTVDFFKIQKEIIESFENFSNPEELIFSFQATLEKAFGSFKIAYHKSTDVVTSPNSNIPTFPITFKKREFGSLELEALTAKPISKRLDDFLSSITKLLGQTLYHLDQTSQLTDFIENGSLPLHWVGPDGIIIWANTAELSALGYSKEEYIGQSITKFHAEPVVIQDILTRLTNNEILENYEAKLIRKDGSVRDVLINSSVYRQNGEFIHTRCFTRDVTDLKQLSLKEKEFNLHLSSALKAIEAEKENLHDFFEQAPVPMVIIEGEDYFFKLANPPYEKFIGRPATGKKLLEIFSEEEVEIFIPLLDKVYKTGVAHVGKELPLKIKDEAGNVKQLWIDIGYHPFRNSDGSIKGILAIVQDVSESVITRHKVEAEKLKVDAMFTLSPAAIALFHGPTHTIERVNDEWIELVGPREYIGKTYREAYPELLTTTLPGILDKVFESGETYEAYEMLVPVEVSPGQIENRYYDFSYVRILDENDQPYGLFCHALNVTQRVLDHSEQNKMVKNLEIERDLREKFVAALSHDLRTPLTAAKLSAQILAKKELDPIQMHKITSRIVNNMDRADKMIRDILDASRIKAGEKVQIDIQECDLNGIVVSTIEDLSTVHGDRFIVSTDENSIKGFWDCTAVQRSVENLANNAIKYGSSLTQINIGVEKRDDMYAITVQNQGNVIAPADLKSIFEPYKRTNSALTGEQKGWGLGLTLVRGFAEAHGGNILVDSSLTEGTTFTILLPQDSRRFYEESYQL